MAWCTEMLYWDKSICIYREFRFIGSDISTHDSGLFTCSWKLSANYTKIHALQGYPK
jgi:hypothetical protein